MVVTMIAVFATVSGYLYLAKIIWKMEMYWLFLVILEIILFVAFAVLWSALRSINILGF